jgi:sulfate transport system substrate-binding protein
VNKMGRRKAATADIEFLYSPQGQDIIARHYNRVNDAAVAKKKYAAQFPEVRLATINGVFGGWDKVTAEHFKNGGILDQAMATAPVR